MIYVVDRVKGHAKQKSPHIWQPIVKITCYEMDLNVLNKVVEFCDRDVIYQVALLQQVQFVKLHNYAKKISTGPLLNYCIVKRT